MTDSSLFAPLLPPCVKIAEMDPRDSSIGALEPAEQRVVADAVPHRQREFAAGRQLAHGLIGDLGYPRTPLLAHPDRSPRWPEGLVGSITHCEGRVAVAVGRSSEVMGIGIDIEPCAPLPAELGPLVLTADERRRVDAWSAEDGSLRSRWVFSAKEATYKAVYPLTRKVLEFSDLEVFGGPMGFVSVLRRQAPPFPEGTSFVGHRAAVGGYMANAVVLRPT
ncbi:4'-phosphopantetheinyl transferase superfamily protein [Kitasatospora aureofaciens]|uniref:4'-phosphopantetheinyl transferase family protein n=1 Tax=Kitasatospora aureofaciens TaxID=1894 RepID=UPI001C4885F2|nr:4'-phosphopantetheinyl transferase superfamily protein [Kitasatospora aureofaciens]MBV6695659.1 4'-phosphopantetheinyl transferase superfamily protein [Kitasatospora aureofaciens]